MKTCRPGVTSIRNWPWTNRGFYARFLAWLDKGGYTGSTLPQYAMGARLALGLLDKPYWLIDLEADLARVGDYLEREIPSAASRATYAKGVRKLAEFLRITCHRPAPEKTINWDYHLAGLPTWICEEVRAYLQHQRRGWLPELSHKNAIGLLSRLATFLRWAASRLELVSTLDFTPELWYDYVDERLAAGIKPDTVNGQLQLLQEFLRFLLDAGRPVAERTLKIQVLSARERIPKDASVEKLRGLLGEIEQEAASCHAGVRRTGVLDRAWFLLMLHSGLRTGEVRRLKTRDLDFERRTVRIEQSKGLKDRTVYLSGAAITAIQAFLKLRGLSNTDYVFLYRHTALSSGYCSRRLRTYARRCGVRVTPHQLRHSCATLLLNAGAPVLAVKTILGHRHVTTTLGYARLYDGTVAADYYRAMAEVERRLDLPHGHSCLLPTTGRMLALVDSLSSGTLNDAQRRTVQALRAVVVEMIEQEATPA